MSIAGFFVLLAMAILLGLAGNRLIPVVMPSGQLKTIALGWAGGFWVAGQITFGGNLAPR